MDFGENIYLRDDTVSREHRAPRELYPLPRDTNIWQYLHLKDAGRLLQAQKWYHKIQKLFTVPIDDSDAPVLVRRNTVHKLLTDPEDNLFIEIHEKPHLQKFISMIMKGVMRIAEVVTVKDDTNSYYSVFPAHSAPLENLPELITADLCLCELLLHDTDHEKYNMYKDNTTYWLFDFGKSKLDSDSKPDMAQVCNKYCKSQHDYNQVWNLLRHKITNFLDRYDSADGQQLFLAQFQKSGLQTDTAELNSGFLGFLNKKQTPDELYSRLITRALGIKDWIRDHSHQ